MPEEDGGEYIRSKVGASSIVFLSKSGMSKHGPSIVLTFSMPRNVPL